MRNFEWDASRKIPQPQAYLDAQIERLIELGYPQILGVGATSFRQVLSTLASYLPEAGEMPTFIPSCGHLPFVLVINTAAMPVRKMIPLIERRGKTAVERLYPIEPELFHPTEDTEIPEGHAYLLWDIDRGMDTLNVTPEAALHALQAQQRSPLTIEEGAALLTHYPEFLQPNNCFLMLGSRCGDKRVPALWLSDGRPKLGWCWAGNPHTWLGSASCAKRSPAVKLMELLGEGSAANREEFPQPLG
ncbi:MAG TPA: DUF5701 family protein [Pseudoduganella sp.]